MKTAKEIADGLRLYAATLYRVADILDPPTPRQHRRRRVTAQFPELDAARISGILSTTHPTRAELARSELKYTTEQPVQPVQQKGATNG